MRNDEPSWNLFFVTFAVILVLVFIGCPSPTGNGELDADGAADVTVEFPAVETSEVTFTGATSSVVKPELLFVSVEGEFTGHVWYLNGSTEHAGISADADAATIDTAEIGYGTHSVGVIVAEGYSAQFSFNVVAGDGE